jgi:hypothetical protein
MLLAAVAALSVALAILTTPTAAVWPGWIYMLLVIVMPVHGARTGRRRKRLLAARATRPPDQA